MDLKDYFEATWEARGRLLTAAAALSPEEWEREFPFSFKSLRRLFAHIIEVEGSWVMENIEKSAWHYLDEAEVVRMYATPEMARARGEEVAEQTRRVLAGYVPDRLRELRRGTEMDGTEATFTVEQILTHVFTHELRHQGQLQVMLRLLGKSSPNADWI
ncbi:MAG: DinB family protein [Candidatus Eiseniibacteriota bacterium]